MVEATVAVSFHKEQKSEEAVASSCWQGPMYFLCLVRLSCKIEHLWDCD